VFDWDDIEEEELEKQQKKFHDKFHQGLLADEAHQEGENKSAHNHKTSEDQQGESIHDFIGSVEVPSQRRHSSKENTF
jgi:hypothetical protein